MLTPPGHCRCLCSQAGGSVGASPAEPQHRSWPQQPPHCTAACKSHRSSSVYVGGTAPAPAARPGTAAAAAPPLHRRANRAWTCLLSCCTPAWVSWAADAWTMSFGRAGAAAGTMLQRRRSHTHGRSPSGEGAHMPAAVVGQCSAGGLQLGVVMLGAIRCAGTPHPTAPSLPPFAASSPAGARTCWRRCCARRRRSPAGPAWMTWASSCSGAPPPPQKVGRRAQPVLAWVCSGFPGQWSLAATRRGVG